MHKNMRLISAAAACLMTIGPLATPLVVHADSVNVTPGTNDDLTTSDIKVNLVVKNAYALSNGQSATAVQTDLSSTVGKATLLAGANVYVVKASDNVTDANSAKAAAVKDLKAGTQYVVVATDAGIQNLSSNKEYNVTIGDGQGKKITSSDFGIINSLGLIKSKAFTVPDSSINGSPYFTKTKSDKVITDATLDLPINNVHDMAKAITDNIDANGGDSKNTAYDTDLVSDFTSQLQAQKLTVNADGSFTPKTDKLTINYIVHFANGKTGTLPVTFNINKNAVDPASPVISINDNSKVTGNNGSFTYSDLDINSNVTPQDIAKAFKAQASKDDNTAVDITVQSSTLNTAIPGIYNVVLTAKNKDGKISTANVSVAVKTKDTNNSNTNNSNTTDPTKPTEAKNMTVQYEDGEAVPVYKVKDGKAVKSGLELKNGSIVATFGSETIDGVSYTKIVNDSGSMLVPTKFLDGSYQIEKRATRKVMHAAFIYTEDGKRKNSTVFRAYSKITTMGNPVKIGDTMYYKIGQNQYVKAGNIDGTKRKLTKKAYLYNSHGQVIKTKKGAKYAVKKGNVVTTYGSHFKIGKSSYYRVGENRYIKVANFGKAIVPKLANLKKALDSTNITAGKKDTKANNNDKSKDTSNNQSSNDESNDDTESDGE